MFLALYITGFILLLVFTALLFAIKSVQVKTFISGGFLLSIALYVLGFFFESGNIIYKLLIVLPRDLAVFSAFLYLVNKFAPRPKWIYFLLAFITLVLKFWYFDTLQKSFDFSETEHAEFLIDLKDPADYQQLLPIIETWKLVMEPAFPLIGNPDGTSLDDFFLINIPVRYELFASYISYRIKNNNDVEWIEQNEIVTLSPTEGSLAKNSFRPFTNDPEVEKQWGLFTIKAPELHDLLSGKKPTKAVTLAILDTGIDSQHEDLNANSTSFNEKYDTDVMGHGTHCAGIAAAVSDNGKGVASMVPSSDWVKVVSVKVLNDNGSGTQQTIIQGIIEAVDKGADVLSLSLGGYSNDSEQRAYNEAIKYAQNAGAIVVVAAGNSSDDAKNYSPANAVGVITVAAVDNHLNPATFTNSVKNIKMGVSAPGVNILSTFPKNGYKSLNGTSMATPYVASTVALMKAIQPNLTTHDAYLLLLQTGQSTGNLDKTGPLIDSFSSIKKLF